MFKITSHGYFRPRLLGDVDAVSTCGRASCQARWDKAGSIWWIVRLPGFQRSSPPRVAARHCWYHHKPLLVKGTRVFKSRAVVEIQCFLLLRPCSGPVQTLEDGHRQTIQAMHFFDKHCDKGCISGQVLGSGSGGVCIEAVAEPRLTTPSFSPLFCLSQQAEREERARSTFYLSFIIQ